MAKFWLIILIFVWGISLIPAGFVWAVIESGTGSNVLAEVKPSDPRPGEKATISLSGYGFDLARSHFRWFRDGQETAVGFGQKTYTFQLGQLGQKTAIKVLISYNSRLIAEKNFIFEPTDLKLSWQAESLVPPFYQGKPRASAGSTLKILAEPHIVNSQGQLWPPANLIYRWTRDGVPVEASQEAQNILTVDTLPSDLKIKINLRAYTPDNQQSASAELLLNLEQPRIIFYEKKPLTGTNYLKQINNPYELYGEEAVFQALPLFWPLKSLNQVTYVWQVNNLVVKNQPTDPDRLVVRQPTNSAGLNEISLQIKSQTPNTQTANGRFNIKFGGNLLKFNQPNQ